MLLPERANASAPADFPPDRQYPSTECGSPAPIFSDTSSGQGRLLLFFPRDGEPRSVVGIVSQYVVSAPHVRGYRLLPRYETDLSTPPLLLPVTGGDRTEAGHEWFWSQLAAVLTDKSRLPKEQRVSTTSSLEYGQRGWKAVRPRT